MIIKEDVQRLKDVINCNQKTKELENEIKKEMEEKIKILREQRKYNELIEDEKSLKEKLVEQAKQEFKETKNKKLLGGIGIRESKIYIYDEKEAFEWAKQHELCIQLDKKSFENIIKTQNLDFVDSEPEIKVTFPKEIKLDEQK